MRQMFIRSSFIIRKNVVVVKILLNRMVDDEDAPVGDTSTTSPDGILVRMDPCPNGSLSEWIPVRMDPCPNGSLSEWILVRMEIHNQLCESHLLIDSLSSHHFA